MAFFDFRALVAIQFPTNISDEDPEDDLSAFIFVTTTKKRFLEAQLALAVQGLRIRDLLNKGR